MAWKPSFPSRYRLRFLDLMRGDEDDGRVAPRARRRRAGRARLIPGMRTSTIKQCFPRAAAAPGRGTRLERLHLEPAAVRSRARPLRTGVVVVDHEHAARARCILSSIPSHLSMREEMGSEVNTVPKIRAAGPSRAAIWRSRWWTLALSRLPATRSSAHAVKASPVGNCNPICGHGGRRQGRGADVVPSRSRSSSPSPSSGARIGDASRDVLDPWEIRGHRMESR